MSNRVVIRRSTRAFRFDWGKTNRFKHFYKLQLVSDKFAFSMTKCAKWMHCVRHQSIKEMSICQYIIFQAFLDSWREYKIKNKLLATCNDDACKPFCSLQSWLVCVVLGRRHIFPYWWALFYAQRCTLILLLAVLFILIFASFCSKYIFSQAITVDSNHTHSQHTSSFSRLDKPRS